MFAKITYLKSSILYVEAEGKLDIYGAPDYLDQVKEQVCSKYAKELVLDFSKITFIASIGLRVILELHKMMQGRNGTLKLKNVNKEVLYSFELTGFDKFLIIENNSDNSEEKESEELNDLPKQDVIANVKSNSAEETVSKIVKDELSDILNGLNKWYYQIAIIMGCSNSGESIEQNIIKTLLQDDSNFNKKIKIYEKISKNEYINEWTSQRVPFNDEIQKLFSDLIPKLKEIRARIKQS